MNPRFDKFFETQLNMYYGQYVFETTIDYEDKDSKEQYETLLRNFKINLNISHLIDREEQVFDYIEKNNEDINEEDKDDFVTFSRMILELLYEINKTYEKTDKKITIDLTKKQIKEREQESRRLVREQKEQERLSERNREKQIKQQIREQKEHERLSERTQNKILKEQKELQKREERLAEKTETKILKEQKELQKREERLAEKLQREKEKIDTKEYNLHIIDCNCGVQIARMNLRNHQLGRDHQLRIEGMCWLIKKYNLDIDI